MWVSLRHRARIKLLVHLLLTLTLVRGISAAGRTRARAVQPKLSDTQGGEEYAFNLQAFLDPVRGVVRIYTELQPKYVWPIGTGELHLPHVNACFFRGNGTQKSAPSTDVTELWKYGSQEMLRTVHRVWAYTVECNNTGEWAETVEVQLSTGKTLGGAVPIEWMTGERVGKLAACSQPLFTDIAGIRDWVDYHSRMGVEKFIMHVPLGEHVDALFDTRKREERIQETVRLNERSPESIGLQPLRRFNHSLVEWHEYRGAPSANYYSETPLFNACVYRLRYAYDFVMLYDCDEWFTITRNYSAKARPRTIPSFLRSTVPPHAASLQLDAYAFPAQCAMTNRGDYSSRFTLRKPAIWENMQKSIVRPLAVASQQIHGVVNITKQFEQNHTDASGRTKAVTKVNLPTDVAYIKHIRWFGPPNGTAISCKFGSEAYSWDPPYTLVIQDDAPRRPSREEVSVATS